MARTRSRRINDLSLADSFIEGISSEGFVEEALQYLMDQEWIRGFQQSDDDHDWLGMDFTVDIDTYEDQSFEKMPLQVKSSFNSTRRHQRRHPDIPFVVVEDRDTLSEVAWKILVALNLGHPLAEELSQKLYKSLTYQL